MYKFTYIDGVIYGNTGIMCNICGHIDIHNIKNSDYGTSVTCSKCNSKVQIKKYCNTIDPNIAPYIEELNKLGYKTLFSCEGHECINNFKDSIEYAYIYFADCFRMSMLFSIGTISDSIFDNWYIDGADLLRGKFILRGRDNSTLEGRLNDLKELINLLKLRVKNV